MLTFWLRPDSFGAPDGVDLANSLERADGHLAVPDACDRVAASTWRCVVEDDPGSGQSGEYRLVVDDGRCWRGARPERRKSDRRPLRGCVGFLDFVSP